MNNTLKAEIENCTDEVTLEDLFLPFKPKKKTKASKAKENGLEPLAQDLYVQHKELTKLNLASFTCKAYPTEEEVIKRAKDIVIEWISEDKESRNIVRKQVEAYAIICSKVIKTKISEAEKFKQYFDYHEKLSTCPSTSFF